MKVNQIVTEHKKGVRAMKYASKTKSTVPLYGPGKQDAKLTPVKPTKPVKEDAPIGVVSAVSPDGKEVTIKKTDGSELKTTGSAVMPGPDGKTAQLAPQAGAGLKPGTPVTNSGTESAVSEEGNGATMSMPTTEFVKGIYAAAAENGMDTPEVEAVKKQMVLAPNGEVDIMATMQKALQVFHSPEWKKMIADLDELIKRAEAQPMEAGEDTVSPRFAGVQQTKHADGSQTTDYQQGPLQTTNKVDAQGRPVTSKSSYELGVAKVDSELDHKSGIRSNAVTTPGMDPNELLPTSNIAAARGVDPAKFSRFQQQNPSAVKESADDKLLRNMLDIAGIPSRKNDGKAQVNEHSDITALLRIAGIR